MIKSYLGAVCGELGSYGIVFRDFPGCVSAGDTIDEVLAMGAEALHGHIASMADAGDLIPEPTIHGLADVQQWLADPSDPVHETWEGLHPVAVDVPMTPDTVTVRLKAELVRKIASMAEAGAGRLNSRQFIERAVEHELDRYRKSAA